MKPTEKKINLGLKTTTLNCEYFQLTQDNKYEAKEYLVSHGIRSINVEGPGMLIDGTILIDFGNYLVRIMIPPFHDIRTYRKREFEEFLSLEEKKNE